MPDRLEIASRLLRTPRLWFTFRVPVRRVEFAASGALLLPLKYAIDALLWYVATGTAWSPLGYLHPLMTVRMGGVPPNADWIVWAMAALMVPCVWIGVSMTVRRCLDGGLSAATAALFFIPAVNWVFLAILCVLPSGPSRGVSETRADRSVAASHRLLRSVGSGAIVGLAMLVLSAVLLEEYGGALFLGTPFALGAVAGFVFNRAERMHLRATFGATMTTLLIVSVAILMFALEGVICLVMAVPIAIPLALAGAWIGRELAGLGQAPTAALGPMAVALPVLLLLDIAGPGPQLHAVRTAIDVNAPREAVWRHVIAFPPLPEPRELVFRAGIAAPMGATIVGVGPGAVRRCEFTTGTFVEPITVWDEPERLAFDVVVQPLPMTELSPWSRVFAPHLERSLVSRRGEFHLIALPGGRTRLEGSTWYTLDLEPEIYWAGWSDAIVHAIHRRVLEHVRALAEAESQAPPTL